MKCIRIYRHVDCEGPAYLQTLLDEKAIPTELIRIDQNESVLPQLDNVAGLIFMGGNMSVNDPLDWISEELALIRRAVQLHIPVMGICLGSQLIAKALGARVYPGPCMEIGWYTVDCHNGNDMTANLPAQMPVFHWHGETFDLPDQAQLLFSNERYAHQGFRIGPHLGLQFHVEMDADQVHDWINRNPADLDRRCEQAHDAEAILQQLDTRIAALNQLARHLLNNWLRGCNLN